MAKDTGVFLPDEAEPQIPKKSPQSARVGDEAKRAVPANADHTDLAKLSEQELKSAIVAAWKKHEELAKQDLAPMLYWLREKLGAQGARNDLTIDAHRGWELWVTEHLDISRRTADRWCLWYAEKEGLVPTSGHTTGSDEDDFYEDILDSHKGKKKITLSCYVSANVHSQYQKALTTIQNKFGLENKHEALVRGVIYAAAVIDKGAAGRGSAKVVGNLSLRNNRRANAGNNRVRKGARSTPGGRKAKGAVPMGSHSKAGARHKQTSLGREGHGGEESSKAMRATAGQ